MYHIEMHKMRTPVNCRSKMPPNRHIAIKHNALCSVNSVHYRSVHIPSDHCGVFYSIVRSVVCDLLIPVYAVNTSVVNIPPLFCTLHTGVSLFYTAVYCT